MTDDDEDSISRKLSAKLYYVGETKSFESFRTIAEDPSQTSTGERSQRIQVNVSRQHAARRHTVRHHTARTTNNTKSANTITIHIHAKAKGHIPKKIPYKKVAQIRNLCMLVNFVFPILMISVGAVKYDDCPYNNRIPMYLIIGGCLGFLYTFVEMCKKIRSVKLVIITGSIMCIWFMISAVNVFVEFEPDYYETGKRFCDMTLYKFALWISVVQIFIILMMLIYLCFITASSQEGQASSG